MYARSHSFFRFPIYFVLLETKTFIYHNKLICVHNYYLNAVMHACIHMVGYLEKSFLLNMHTKVLQHFCLQ